MTKRMLICALMVLPFFATAQEESFTPHQYTWIMTIQPTSMQDAAEFEPVYREMEALIARFNQVQTRSEGDSAYRDFQSFLSGLQTSISNGLNVLTSVATSTEASVEAQAAAAQTAIAQEVQVVENQVNAQAPNLLANIQNSVAAAQNALEQDAQAAAAQVQAVENQVNAQAPGFLDRIDAVVDSAIATVTTTASSIATSIAQTATQTAATVSNYLPTLCIGFSCQMTQIDELYAWNKARLLLEKLASDINNKNITTEQALLALQEIRYIIDGLPESTLLLYAGKETQAQSNNVPASTDASAPATTATPASSPVASTSSSDAQTSSNVAPATTATPASTDASAPATTAASVPASTDASAPVTTAASVPASTDASAPVTTAASTSTSSN